ncbi:MAG: hypothetical protein JWP00_4029 [Chloroflexi bacterium]|jgi:hypothetical protein|nr:hypothetical protein [Chloroflexota bacterium]
MADIALLDMARQAEQLADFCQTLKGRLRLTDISIDSEMGRFFLSHKGETPDVLRRNYAQWQDNLLQSLPQFSAVVRQCRRQAVEWRAEYNLQEQAEAQARRAEAEAASKAQAEAAKN